MSKEPRVVPNYQQQAMAAEAAQRELFKQMQAEGWQYDERQRYWWHPDKPGVTISQ